MSEREFEPTSPHAASATSADSSGTPSSAKIVLAFAAIYTIWGSTYLAIRIGIETLPPFTMIAVRFALAGGGLYAVLRVFGTPRPSWQQWRDCAVIGTLLLCGGNGLVALAQRTIPSGSAALFVAMVPIFMVLFDRLWAQGPRLNALTIAGVTTGFLGVVTLVSSSNPGETRHLPLGGAAAIVFATLSWSFGSVWARERDLPRSPFMTTAMQMLTGSITLAIGAVAMGELRDFDVAAVSVRSWLALGYLILFGSIVALSSYVWLLQNVPVARVSTYAFVNPVVALFLGWWIAGEVFTGGLVVASLLVIAGVVMIHSARSKPAPPRGEVDAASAPRVGTRRVLPETERA